MRTRLTLVLALLLTAPAARAQTPAPPAGTIEYYHVDALGAVRAVTDASGAVVRLYHYHPFGEGVGVEAGTDPMRFTGKPRDGETGLDYFGARYYAPRTGRFTTIDPVMHVTIAVRDPQRWNRYAYALNSPGRYTDEDGREALSIGAAIYLGAAATATAAYLISPQGREATSQVLSDIGRAGAAVWSLGRSLFASEDGSQDTRTSADRLRKDGGGNATPDPEAAGREHSQLGTKESKNTGEKYRQAREFDANGKEVRRIDFTDHGRPKDHANPHQHVADPQTGKIGPAQALPIIKK